MPNPKWTPGPWELCHHLKSADSDKSCPCGYRGSIWGSDGNHVVCEMGASVIPGEEGLEADRYDRDTEIANAHLIAQAPEMAAILQRIVDAPNDIVMTILLDEARAILEAAGDAL